MARDCGTAAIADEDQLVPGHGCGPTSRREQAHRAIAILAESHVAVHLDAAKDSRSAHLEMFSCKDFSAPLFAELCRSTFGLEDALAINLPRRELSDARVAPRGDPWRLRDLRPQKHGFLDGLLHRLLGRSV